MRSGSGQDSRRARWDLRNPFGMAVRAFHGVDIVAAGGMRKVVSIFSTSRPQLDSCGWQLAHEARVCCPCFRWHARQLSPSWTPTGVRSSPEPTSAPGQRRVTLIAQRLPRIRTDLHRARAVPHRGQRQQIHGEVLLLRAGRTGRPKAAPIPASPTISAGVAATRAVLRQQFPLAMHLVAAQARDRRLVRQFGPQQTSTDPWHPPAPPGP